MTSFPEFLSRVDWDQGGGFPFQVPGQVQSIDPHIQGHINDTYFVSTSVSSGADHHFVLQRINSRVFQKPIEVMHNIARVTDHLHDYYHSQARTTDPLRRSLHLVAARDGSSWFRDREGHLWRLYQRVPRALTYNQLKDSHQAYRVGKAFAEFQSILSTLPGAPLFETIPFFHHTPKRFQNLLHAQPHEYTERRVEVKSDIEWVRKFQTFVESFEREVHAGRIPLRTVHNDTKLNNILFDQDSDRALCIIDLDTVMPGNVLYDFGDLVRTCVCQGGEDNPRLEQLSLDFDIFEKLTSGYIESARFLNSHEKQGLVFAGQMITLELGMRFLRDYIDGDLYFKVRYPQHNLDRARAQFRYVELLQQSQSQLQRIVSAVQ